MEKNYGIRISGGHVSAGAIAAGEGATATNISAVSADSLADARTGMAQLLELLRTHSEQLDRPDEAIASSESVDVEGRRIPVIGLAALLKNKRAAAREQDLADVKALEAIKRSAVWA